MSKVRPFIVAPDRVTVESPQRIITDASALNWAGHPDTWPNEVYLPINETLMKKAVVKQFCSGRVSQVLYESKDRSKFLTVINDL